MAELQRPHQDHRRRSRHVQFRRLFDLPGFFNSDPIPHLTTIANSIGTGEAYTFTYSTFTLADPFTSTSFGTTTKLATMSLTNDSPAEYQFTADSSGALSKAILVDGGYIKWNYSSAGYNGSTVYQMEVSSRILSKDGTTGSETTYSFTHESSTGAIPPTPSRPLKIRVQWAGPGVSTSQAFPPPIRDETVLWAVLEIVSRVAPMGSAPARPRTISPGHRIDG